MEIVNKKGITANVVAVKPGDVFKYKGDIYCKAEPEKGWGQIALNLKNGQITRFLNYGILVEILPNAKLVFEEKKWE